LPRFDAAPQKIRPDEFAKRRRVLDIKADFSSALAMALKLAKTKEPGYLTGWCGPLNEVD
jgi:hypothetical protein